MTLPPRVDLTARDTVRLITSGRLEDALRPLAASDAALRDLAEIERATHGRLLAEESGLPDLDPRELVFARAGHAVVNAAFAYTRPGGNRFNDESRGAWYCGSTVETALAEVAYHLTRELAAVGRFDNATDYAELIADFMGSFHDLRVAGWASDPALHTDPAIAYPAGQALARRLRGEAAAVGIVYPSARRAGGACLVAFRPDLVQNLREGGVWRLVWKGSPEPSMRRV